MNDIGSNAFLEVAKHYVTVSPISGIYQRIMYYRYNQEKEKIFTTTNNNGCFHFFFLHNIFF